MLTEAQNYKLPANMIDQRSMLNKYIDLRIQHTQLWIKAEKEQNATYYKTMDSLTKEIDGIINAFSKENN